MNLDKLQVGGEVTA